MIHLQRIECRKGQIPLQWRKLSYNSLESADVIISDVMLSSCTTSHDVMRTLHLRGVLSPNPRLQSNQEKTSDTSNLTDKIPDLDPLKTLRVTKSKGSLWSCHRVQEMW